MCQRDVPGTEGKQLTLINKVAEGFIQGTVPSG